MRESVNCGAPPNEMLAGVFRKLVLTVVAITEASAVPDHTAMAPNASDTALMRATGLPLRFDPLSVDLVTGCITTASVHVETTIAADIL